MRVALRRNAVRRPAGVGDAGAAGGGCRIRLGGEFGNAPDGAQAMQSAIEDGKAGGVVAAVFELAQAFQQDGDDVAVSDRGDDATWFNSLLRNFHGALPGGQTHLPGT